MTQSHIPVLKDEILAALLPAGASVNRVIDGTLGAGGHARALLEAGAGELLGLDLDPAALQLAREALAPFADRAHIVHGSYADMIAHARTLGWDAVDAILLDLGVSSMQLDTPERGFAFRHDGDLDMRFDPSGSRPTAAEIVNHWDAAELADLFYKWGEERYSRRIAKAIVSGRPYQSTVELAEVIRNAVPGGGRGDHIHPATRVFQALRIAVNDELNIIENALPAAIDLLQPGGRLAVISFHSLEDRIVKRCFKSAGEAVVSPPGMMLEEKEASVRLITRKPITATEAEIGMNPRSRSAKLRVVERL